MFIAKVTDLKSQTDFSLKSSCSRLVGKDQALGDYLVERCYREILIITDIIFFKCIVVVKIQKVIIILSRKVSK